MAVQRTTSKKQTKTSNQFKPMDFLSKGKKPKMNQDQLDECTNKVNDSAESLKLHLLAVYFSKGWKSAGYLNFKDYVESCLTISYDAALKQAIAARVTFTVIGLDAVGKISDASMLAMKELTLNQQKNVLKHIRTHSEHDPIENSSLTANQVKNAIHELFPKPVEEGKQPEEDEIDKKRKDKLKKFQAELKHQSQGANVAKAIIAAFIETQSPHNIETAAKLLSSHLDKMGA